MNRLTALVKTRVKTKENKPSPLLIAAIFTIICTVQIFGDPANALAEFSILHSFAGYPNDGSDPFGSLTLSGSTLYGMTSSGGSALYGTIFQINTDGSGYQVLTYFTNPSIVSTSNPGSCS